MQAHPALQIAVKMVIGAIAITGVYQSQLHALWLQYIVAAVAAVLVAAYGFSRSSLSPSGLHSCTTYATALCNSCDALFSATHIVQVSDPQHHVSPQRCYCLSIDLERRWLTIQLQGMS